MARRILSSELTDKVTGLGVQDAPQLEYEQDEYEQDELELELELEREQDDICENFKKTKEFLNENYFMCVLENLTLSKYMDFCLSETRDKSLLENTTNRRFLRLHLDIILKVYSFSMKYCTYEEFLLLVYRNRAINCCYCF